MGEFSLGFEVVSVFLGGAWGVVKEENVVFGGVFFCTVGCFIVFFALGRDGENCDN